MREEKKLLLDEIQEKIDHSQAMIVTHYHNFNPLFSWNFATEIRNMKAEFEVVKKRVFLKAAAQSGISFDLKESKGHLAVLFIYEEDLSPAKALYKFSDDHQDLFEVITGSFEGAVYQSKEIRLLSKLPSKDEMRAQLLGLFEAPLAQTLSVIDNLLCSVPYCLEKKSQKEESK